MRWSLCHWQSTNSNICGSHAFNLRVRKLFQLSTVWCYLSPATPGSACLAGRSFNHVLVHSWRQINSEVAYSLLCSREQKKPYRQEEISSCSLKSWQSRLLIFEGPLKSMKLCPPSSGWSLSWWLISSISCPLSKCLLLRLVSPESSLKCSLWHWAEAGAEANMGELIVSV